MPRILVHAPSRDNPDCRSLLEGQGHDVVVCRDRESLFASVAERRPDVLIYVLEDLVIDLGVLAYLRRAAPKLPLILLGAPTELEARRNVQQLRPTYYGVLPLDPSELSDAVRGALSHAGRENPT